MKLIDRLFIGLLLVVFGGIVLHAPLTVFVGTVAPDYELFIKSWKEVLLGVALVLAVVILTRWHQWGLLRRKLLYLIAGFAALNLLLVPLYFTTLEATLAGLLINLRYFLFFVLVYVAVVLYPGLRRAFLYVFFAGATVVIGFGLLQITVLPHDVLTYLGYGRDTIAPYLTVDQNMDYIRINSTLRGPNPLGAYAVIVLAMAAAVLAKGWGRVKNWERWGLGLLGIGSGVILWVSYSRSALLAGGLALGLLVLVVYGRALRPMVWAGLLGFALLVGGAVFAFRDTPFISQVVLHEDPAEGNMVNSNDGHVESLVDGTGRLLRQPLGAGIGSTGSASLYSDQPVIIENQYLFVAHETGWIGLGLFVAISGGVLVLTWRRRSDWLALAVFSSGLGLMVIGLVLPVWVDDTVSIIWWGLAAVALAPPAVHTQRKARK